MYDPEKRLGEEDKSPAMVVAVKMGKPGKFDPSKRIGEGDAEEVEPRTAEPNQLKDEAAAGLCKALNVSTSAAPRVREYLEAFYRACDSGPEPTIATEDSKE